MTTVHIPAATRERPLSVWGIIAVMLLLGLSAAAGGVALILGAAPPADWLDRIPLIDTWAVPGVVLGVGFGLGSLIVAYGVWRQPGWRWLRPVERLTHHHWSWVATILIGVGQLAWISLELIYLPGLSFLQAVYGGVGLVLVLLPMLPPARAQLRSTA